MVDTDPRRRVIRTGLAASTAFFLFSATAEAQVSGARCNLPEGGGVFATAVVVWVDGVRTAVRIGERGLTREIAFSPSALRDWMRREFAGGDPDIPVGFNDCSGSQLSPLSEPPEADEDAAQPPAPPPVLDPGTGNDTSSGGTPPPGWEPPPTPNDTPAEVTSALGGDEEMIVGDSWDELFA
jgi:hypothetical protein